ncbi:GlsB/YeaQ/YmgE family stress response membrane protein [Sandaracinobacteroides saxicola]|uniref:GlsB/YeaQ/YmgE family stress response membrane protein n=1 Tax=Sandaracinobacteroides saxicola TaxID=2759707 RepID=A0A7G5IGA6_9SPHN|nr:GlsB/YeaQ/YmgE family stress response membrane protein [Sandaracinobacteroides saxicola]QMW22398.1 GlsB/YeaQ/YmgE family stress response membrane protein [Sandaracinobacteroides saxicola]
MSWIGAIIIGFVAGLLARAISSDPRNPQGCLFTTLLGIVGAAVFTWIGKQLGWYADGEWTGFIGATLGAILVLAVWRQVVGNK